MPQFTASLVILLGLSVKESTVRRLNYGLRPKQLTEKQRTRRLDERSLLHPKPPLAILRKPSRQSSRFLDDSAVKSDGDGGDINSSSSSSETVNLISPCDPFPLRRIKLSLVAKHLLKFYFPPQAPRILNESRYCNWKFLCHFFSGRN